jgi:ubiquinone/menaquinone biosynthesis C-methylase UbiE
VIDGRMNMQHYVLYNVFGKKHYLTEFKAGELPKRVLDIGCGTGIWIHDVAKQGRDMGHADVEFVGIDLVPIQTPMVLLWKSV